MTVKELIAELSRYPDDEVVYVFSDYGEPEVVNDVGHASYCGRAAVLVVD